MGLIGTMIETHMGGRKSSENIRKLQEKKLKKLVNYARKNSPYFKELYKLFIHII